MGTTATPETGRPTREETRARLLDGAYEAFCEVGFQAATIEDISARAGFTRGAFYSNFQDKDELLLALWSRTIERTTIALRRGVAESNASSTPLDDLIESLIVLRSADLDWFVLSTEFLLHSLRTPGLTEKVASTRKAFRDHLSAAVGHLLAAEGRRPPDGLDVDGFSQLLIAGHLGCQHVNASSEGGMELPRAMARALLGTCPKIDDPIDVTD